MSDATPQAPPREVGWVYFIQGGDHIKIGWSPDPSKRARDIAVGNPHKLVVLAKCRGSVRDEKNLHRLLKAYRANGEWFHARKPVLALVDWARRHGDPGDEVVAAAARAKEAERQLAHERHAHWRAELARRQAQEEAPALEPEAPEAGVIPCRELHDHISDAAVAMWDALDAFEERVDEEVEATADHEELARRVWRAIRELRASLGDASRHIGSAHNLVCHDPDHTERRGDFRGES